MAQGGVGRIRPLGLGAFVNGMCQFTIIGLGTQFLSMPALADPLIEAQKACYRGRSEQERIDGCTAVMELKPGYSNPYITRAGIYRARGDIQLAIADYSSAIERNPGFYYTYIDRGQLWEKLGDTERAVADYTKAIGSSASAGKPGGVGDEAPYINRARIYFNTGVYDKAIADYTAALEMNPQSLAPKNPNYYYFRGLAWEKTGKLEAAAADYRSCLAIAPGSVAASAALKRVVAGR